MEQSGWKSVIPDESLLFSFQAEDIKASYGNIIQFKKIMIWFSVLAIFIACMGLLGLATYSARQKRREIGIRKVLGAESGGIVLMLSLRFTKWIILANVISWPMVWYFANRFLEEFAYRISIPLWAFFLTLIISMIIGLSTIIIQSIRAASANPVEVLKYE